MLSLPNCVFGPLQSPLAVQPVISPDTSQVIALNSPAATSVGLALIVTCGGTGGATLCVRLKLDLLGEKMPMRTIAFIPIRLIIMLIPTSLLSHIYHLPYDIPNSSVWILVAGIPARRSCERKPCIMGGGPQMKKSLPFMSPLVWVMKFTSR